MIASEVWSVLEKRPEDLTEEEAGLLLLHKEAITDLLDLSENCFCEEVELRKFRKQKEQELRAMKLPQLKELLVEFLRRNGEDEDIDSFEWRKRQVEEEILYAILTERGKQPLCCIAY